MANRENQEVFDAAPCGRPFSTQQSDARPARTVLGNLGTNTRTENHRPNPTLPSYSQAVWGLQEHQNNLRWKMNNSPHSVHSYKSDKFAWNIDTGDNSFLYDERSGYNMFPMNTFFNTDFVQGRKLNIHNHLSHLLFPDDATTYWKLEKVAFEPKVPWYNSYESRLKSFTSDLCPPQLSKKAREMAFTGFFYQQITDHVQCFACGICVHQWENQDDVRLEHKRWAPNSFCPHLMKVCPEVYYK